LPQDYEKDMFLSLMGTPEKHHVCPVWVGYLLASPLRKIVQNPRTILSPHVTPGMCVMDIGSAMGYFSLPLAQLVGPAGRVICVDLQQKMLDALQRRARRANLDGRLEPRLCGPDSLGVADLAGQVDFAMLFAVVHEVGDPSRLFAQIHAALKPAGRVLFAEPKGHVTEPAFRKSIATAEAAGFRSVNFPRISGSHAVVLEKSPGAG
jgi:SAM-dependent methyltransferase